MTHTADIFYTPMVCGSEAAYIVMDGGISLRGRYALTTSLVSHANEKVGPQTKRLVAECPPDWPKRGNNPDLYSEIRYKNFAYLSQWLTEINPRFLVAQCCNQMESKEGMGVSPSFWRNLILLPNEECKLKWVAAARPGTFGISSSLGKPSKLADSTTVQSKASKTPYSRTEALHLYCRTLPLRGKESWWRDLGPFVSNRDEFTPCPPSLNQEEFFKQLERLEAEQFGSHYPQMLANAFRCLDPYHCERMLEARPTLKVAFCRKFSWKDFYKKNDDESKAEKLTSFAEMIQKGEAGPLFDSSVSLNDFIPQLGPSHYASGSNGQGSACATGSIIRSHSCVHLLTGLKEESLVITTQHGSMPGERVTPLKAPRTNSLKEKFGCLVEKMRKSVSKLLSGVFRPS